MNFQTLSFLIGVNFFLLIVSLALYIKGVKEKWKKPHTPILGSVTILILLLTLSIGYVEDEADAAKVNKDNTVTLYLNHKDSKGDTALMKIRSFGPISIKSTTDKSVDKLNKRVRVTRNFIKGTEITYYKDKNILSIED